MYNKINIDKIVSPLHIGRNNPKFDHKLKSVTTSKVFERVEMLDLEKLYTFLLKIDLDLVHKRTS